MLQMATRLLEVRKEWQELKVRSEASLWPPEAVALLSEAERTQAEMRSLAWALDIDLELMDRPKALPFGLQPPAQVQITRIDDWPMWLLEVPASLQEGFGNQFWAALLSERQYHELREVVLAERIGEVKRNLVATGQIAPRPIVRVPQRPCEPESDYPEGA